SDLYEFRSHRKVGFGLGMAGIYGLTGAQLELNFVPEVSLITGFGLGSGYQAFNLQIKRTLTGNSFMPYISGGFARWYSVGDNGRITDTNPGFLSKRFLNDDEKRSGKFAEILLYPALGLQYLQLQGEWSGFSLYA